MLQSKSSAPICVQRVGSCSDCHCRAGSILHSPTEARYQRSERNRGGKKHRRAAVCESVRRIGWRLYRRWHACANRRAPGEDPQFKGRLWQQCSRYENAPKNPAQVAADLGVADLLEGSVRKLGEKFQIAVRLIDGKNGAELWTQSYQRTFPEIIQVESEVARQTAGALGLKLTEPEIHAITRPATSNPLANEAYLKGRYVWLQRTPDSYRQAREYFEQAIALDSNYALAYAGLADAYQFLGAFNLPDRKENYDKAKSAYGRALELDPTLAEAHATAGLVAMNYDWDWSLAEQELRRAIALNPNEALFYDWYAEYLMAVGKANESIDNIERAHELDPFSIIINSDVGKLLFSRDSTIRRKRS
jgi:Predicted integral membrane protein